MTKGGHNGPECYISGNLQNEDGERHSTNLINTSSYVPKDSNADEN